MDDDHFIRLRGLPWTASTEEVAAFLKGCNIVNGPESGIHFTRNFDGRPNGEAFVQLVSEDDVKLAVTKNKEHMGKRYIDVFKVKRSEMDWAFKHSGSHDPYAANDAIVRLRGLPFGCSKEEIANFFTGLEIVPNGITILTDQLGRTTGDAYVQFAHADLVERALLKHKETIGHRYVEIFASNCDELMGTLNRMGRMRGNGERPRPYSYGYMDYTSMGNHMMLGGPGGGMGGGPGCMGGPGAMGFGGRGRFNNRGISEEDFDRFSPGLGGNMGYGGGYMGDYGGGMDLHGMRNHTGYGMRGRGYNSSMGHNSMRGGNAGKRLFVGVGYKGSMGKFESQTGHSIHMRGLPYSATDDDIAQFFSPLTLVRIVLEYNHEGRPSGDANVDFATHEDAQEAMKRHKALMKKRYIELFIHSTPSGRYSSFRNSFGNGNVYGGLGGNYTAF